MNVSWEWTFAMRMPPALMWLEVKEVSVATATLDTQAMVPLV